MRRKHIPAPMLLVALLAPIVLSACERPQRSQTAYETHREGRLAARAQSDSERSAPRLLPQECKAPRSKVSAYSYALAEAIGQWGLHNQPLLEQFRNTRWAGIPELVQPKIAKNVRQGFRESAVKQAIANGSPASAIACKPEFPNCANVAGNLELVGDYYHLIILDQHAEIGKAAANVARGRGLDPAEQWSRIERLDQQLFELSLLLPQSAVLAELEYPRDPPEAATCHAVKRRRKRALPAPAICIDPQTKAEVLAASAASPPTPVSVDVRDLGDLDEDGWHEFAVDLSSAVAMSTTILGSDAEGCAREIITERGGVVHAVLSSRTRGWKDLDVGVPLNRAAGVDNACWVTLRATFDGKAYRMVKVVRVEPFLSGDSTGDLAGCQGWAQELLDE